jgi:hypothetical protein
VEAAAAAVMMMSELRPGVVTLALRFGNAAS